MKKVYICGPMTGIIPGDEKATRREYMARFAEAARLVGELENVRAVNPARFLVCRWPWLYKVLGYRLTLLYDLWRLGTCDHIYKMPGWRESHGANIESCWAFHNSVYTLPANIRIKIDRQMDKFIDQRQKSENYGKEGRNDHH